MSGTRGVGLFVAFALGFAMAKAATVALIHGGTGSSTRAHPMGRVFVVLAVGIMGCALMSESWKAGRSPSGTRLSTVAGLLALTPLATFLSAVHSNNFNWVSGVIFPAGALVLMFWPSRRHGRVG